MTTSGENGSDPKDILTPEELESLRFAQDVYSARAKQAAANLAQTLELSDEVRDQLIGSLSLKLAGTEFEDARVIAIRFDEINAILAGVQATREQRPVSLGLVTPEPGEDAVEPVLDEAAKTEADDSEEKHPINRERVEINKRQKAWLESLYDDDAIKKIESLDPEQFNVLIANITDRYLQLRIPRLTPLGKRTRVEQLVRFMAGKEIKDMAQEYGVTIGSLSQGLAKMADGIGRRVSQADLLSFIPDTPSDTPTDLPEGPGEEGRDPHESKPNPLSRDVKAWYERLYDEKTAEDISQLNADQQGHLAELLARYLKSYLLKNYGPVITAQRVETTVSFLKGAPLAELAASRHMTEEGVKGILDHGRNRIKVREPVENLLRLVAEAQEFTPQQNGNT